MAVKGLTNIIVTKTWRDGRAYFETYVDALRNAIGNVSSITNLNLIQLAKDISPSYSYTNNGTAALSKSLQEQINDIQAGGVPITGTTSNSFSIRSASNYLKFNAATLTTPVTLTAPDVSGEILLDSSIKRNHGAYGLGIKYSSGTFTICKDDGTDLSSANKGWVTMQSITDGLSVTLEVTSNITFNDDAHASSDITGSEFGTTAGVAYGNTRPFFIYALNKDDTSGNLLFSLSPRPNFELTPSSSNIGYKGNPSTNSTDSTMFAITSSSPVDWASLPCLSLGKINMTKSTADDWTVHSSLQDKGFGFFGDGDEYFLSTGLEMGGVGSSYLKSANSPSWSLSSYSFRLNRFGEVTVECYLRGTCTNGTDANSPELVLPFKPSGTIFGFSMEKIIGTYQASAATVTNGILIAVPKHSSGDVDTFRDTAWNTLQNNDFSGAANGIRFSFTTKMF